MAQAAPQNAGAIGGLVAAAGHPDRTVTIDSVRILTVEGGLIDDINVDARNVNILRNVIVTALNENDIDLRDVVDITIEGNVLVVDVLWAADAPSRDTKPRAHTVSRCGPEAVVRGVRS